MTKYQIIYADPPWQYADQKGNDPAMGGILYNTMPLNEILLLPVQRLADVRCGQFFVFMGYDANAPRRTCCD